jgi:hypothetical protein
VILWIYIRVSSTREDIVEGIPGESIKERKSYKKFIMYYIGMF